ncbi:MAG: A24 family peptidase [Pseudomonadota bacterium]
MLIYESPIALGLLILILIIAGYTDIREHRIPNILTFGGLILGLLLQSWMLGGDGFLSGLAGFLIGLGIFLPFYILGKGMAAGDVKLMAALGALLGPQLTLFAAASSLVAGSVMGIGILIIRGGAAVALQRYWSTLKCFAVTGTFNYVPPRHDEAAATRFPYAIAIAAGTLFAVIWLN